MLARKALAGTAGAPKVYVEDVFSTYLYTGNASTQTITNNIDISGKGGLVWTKSRSNATGHVLFDTERGLGTSGNRPDLHTELQDGQVISGEGISSFNSNGYTLENTVSSNGSGRTFVSWTFRKAKKFFDVVTYTGNGSNRTISHNLGSVPGCIIVKRTDTAGAWQVYHRANTAAPETDYLVLNTTAATADSDTRWNDTLPTSTEFSLGTDATVNANSGTYVAYLFAHDAGGFGDAGSDSIIKCGSYTGNGSAPGPTITLDWEPQWIMIKRTDSTGNWFLYDNMRGWPVGSDARELYANDSYQEDASSYNPWITSTGFYPRNADSRMNASGGTYIYIAIRRGPMKTPTSGTDVFAPVKLAANGSTNSTLVSTGFPVDLQIGPSSSDGSNGCRVHDRLRGGGKRLYTDSTSLEDNSSVSFDFMTGMKQQQTNGTPTWYLWRRAPGFLDVVCYTGTGSATTFSHNLGVVPEMIILKRRDAIVGWAVYNSSVGNTKWMQVNTDNAPLTASTIWNDTSPTSSVFSVGTSATVNGSGGTYVAYLFASVSGVSKVGTYTGNGSSVTVTTDFQPRFILVKRTDSTGNWIVGDSARGLVSGSDPYLLLNSTAAEDTDEDWVDVSSTGFTVNETSAANANVNTGTYIYLAIA